jgi:hypothetical protein
LKSSFPSLVRTHHLFRGGAVAAVQTLQTEVDQAQKVSAVPKPRSRLARPSSSEEWGRSPGWDGGFTRLGEVGLLPGPFGGPRWERDSHHPATLALLYDTRESYGCALMSRLLCRPPSKSLPLRAC